MWTKTYEKTSDSQTSANIINLLGTITLFPIPPFNWFVKGGVGMGVRDVDQITGRITVTEDFGKGVALIAGTGVDFSVGRILSWTIEFDYWYGHMGTIHRQNVAFSSAHQRVAVILVGLTFH